MSTRLDKQDVSGQYLDDMTDFEASAPDPEIATSDLGEVQKATLRNALRQVIVIAVVLTLPHGNIGLFGESQEPLHRALDLHKYDEAIRLIRLGADVNAMNADGELPLVLGADDPSTNAYDVVRELLLHRALVNKADSEGYTALHRAVYNGNMGVADLLLRNGADINSVRTYTNFFGEHTETPLEVAYKWGKFRVADFLASMGADIPHNLEDLERMGEMERLIEYYSKLPKPAHLTEDEWAKERMYRVMLDVNPEMAQLMGDFERMNPEAMKTIENILNEPTPEGVDWRDWQSEKAARVQRLIQSGQLNHKIPESKK